MDEWLTLEQARARTGLHPDTLRKQVRKGEREGRKDNHGRWRVRVDPDEPGSMPGPTHPDGPDASARADPDVTRALAERNVQIARLEERLAASEEARAELRRELVEARGDRDRWRTIAEQLVAAGRQAPEQRPWPGLKAWWRRLIEGGG